MQKQSPKGVLWKKVFLEISQNSEENSSPRVSFLMKLQTEVFNFSKKETLTQVFSCEFCEIFQNTFSYRTFPVAAFVNKILKNTKWLSLLAFA